MILRRDLTLLVRLLRQRIYDLLEHLSTMFVVPELVEAGAGRSKQDDIPRLGNLGRVLDRGFQSFGVIDFGAPAFRRNDLGLDRGGRCPDAVNTLHALPEQIVEYGIVAAFVLTPENEVDICRERLD